MEHSIGISYYRVRDFCRALSLPRSTVYRMIEHGLLKAVRIDTAPSGSRGVVRIPKSEFERLVRSAETHRQLGPDTDE